MKEGQGQSGQALVLVAVGILAVAGATALVLVAGAVESQRNQLQELADATALDAAIQVTNSCSAAEANAVIAEADNFLATRRTRTGSLAITPGTCVTPYSGQDTFANGLSATFNYPYRAHALQLEVILTINLPISFGTALGQSSTPVTRRAVAVGGLHPNSQPALSVGSYTCSGGAQTNVQGSVLSQSILPLGAGCAVYAHAVKDPVTGAYTDFGNITVVPSGQAWVAGGGACVAGAYTGSNKALCSDGYEISGASPATCGTHGVTDYLDPVDLTLNPDPCTGTAPSISAPTYSEPNLDPNAVATLIGTGGAACAGGAVYPAIMVGATQVGTGLGPAPAVDAGGYYHFEPSCYGYLDVSTLPTAKAVFDPGFFYFNGSGFAGGGGVCLKGGQLLGRGITMEFVNNTSLSTSTCSSGGGGSCVGSCLFGSQPCSVTPCPPNVPADPPLNLTWLAAPCTLAPSPADAASCPGSAWCPATDAACWMQLVWASPTIGGNLELKGGTADGWLLGSVNWPGACRFSAPATVVGGLSCQTLTIQSGVLVAGPPGAAMTVTEVTLLE